MDVVLGGGVRAIGLVISRNDKHNLTLTSRTIYCHCIRCVRAAVESK
jgi:hypothetical protein